MTSSVRFRKILSEQQGCSESADTYYENKIPIIESTDKMTDTYFE